MLRAPALILLFGVLLSSCGRRMSAGRQEDGDTLRLKYSTLLQIVRHEGYTEVSIRNPWRKGSVLHTYLLVPRSAAMPAGLPQGTVVRTPVGRAAVFTTVHCSLLTTLGHSHRIVAVADLKYIKTPAVLQAVAQGRVADCGDGMSPVAEKIIEARPDIIMLSPFENSGGYGKLEDIGIPLVECAEYMEPSPLARAEWMKFYGLLLGAQSRADSLFAVVDSSYHALRHQAAQAGPGRSVLIDKMTGSVWYVPGGRSTLGQMVRDAGGRYPWADNRQSGSLALPFESVLQRAGQAQVWMFRHSGSLPASRQRLLAEHHGYRQLAAFQTGDVYACNVEQTLFYEETPFRPDRLLADFIRILHPAMPHLPPLRYYQKIE